MKRLWLVAAFVLVAGCSSSKRENLPPIPEAPAPKVVAVNVALPTMICKNCKKTIEAAVYRVSGVTNVSLDVDKRSASIMFDSDWTDLAAVESAISKAGYDANDVKRDSAAYENLDACCKKN